MTRYYLIVDTKKERIGIRRENLVDKVNDSLFTDPYWTLKYSLSEFGVLEWKEIDEKMNKMADFVDKIGHARGNL